MREPSAAPLRRCPITYEPLAPDEEAYSREGLRRLSRYLERLEPLPFTTAELVREAAARAARMSIGGVQPKVSAVLRPSRGLFEVVTVGGRYVLKPESPAYPEVPANEDVTMRMAAAAGVAVPTHGLLYTRDGEPCYFVERFDRVGRGEKLAVEDFAQLLGLSRDTKYASSMERVAGVVEAFCTFPAVEKVELFRRTVVAFLTGIEDMHLKNFSLLTDREGLRRLTPAYDLVNSTAVLRDPEELALPLAGKRSRLKREHLVDYYGRERLGLTGRVIARVLTDVAEAQPAWDDLLGRSFLSAEMRDRYAAVLADRRARMGMPR